MVSDVSTSAFLKAFERNFIGTAVKSGTCIGTQRETGVVGTISVYEEPTTGSDSALRARLGDKLELSQSDERIYFTTKRRKLGTKTG
ncbi:hypothetical protein EVAR_18897_1 [Eumeta japonica]|uniref:Uncharacterized protein n=1 Tax=Eumeta variegata TaxID=151549 RepID=A0A4C1V3E6_EUMVA|nr:hypothetical protein EVAR_18897_1 [Eumeta japonica]